MADLGNKILGAIDRAINGTPPPRKDWALEAATTICTAALPRVKSALGADDWAIAQKCYANQKRFVRMNSDLGENAATRAHARQLAEQQKLISEGGDPGGIARGRSLESWKSDFESRRLALTAEIQKNYAVFKPFQSRIIAVVLETFLSECASLMLEESKLASKFSIPYQESPSLKILRSLDSYIRNRSDVIILEM